MNVKRTRTYRAHSENPSSPRSTSWLRHAAERPIALFTSATASQDVRGGITMASVAT
jgi:hypothetical protein